MASRLAKQLHQFIRSRSSIRTFRNAPVPLATLRRVLATAISAPSAHHSQPWRFAIIKNKPAQLRLAMSLAVAFEQRLRQEGVSQTKANELAQRSIDRICGAPTAIVVSMQFRFRTAKGKATNPSAEHTMAIQSVANAATCLLLGAHAEGLGSVWTCAPLYAPRAVRAALRLPKSWEPQALILLGRPAKKARRRSRLPLASVVQFT